MYTRSLLRLLASLAVLAWLPGAVLGQQPSAASSPPVLLQKPSILYKVQSSGERLEMMVHTSRIVTMDRKIAQAQVDNPEILDLTPLSPNQIQVSSKAAGITQLNLWDEDKKYYAVSVIVERDAQELSMLLQATFPAPC